MSVAHRGGRDLSRQTCDTFAAATEAWHHGELQDPAAPAGRPCWLDAGR